MRTMPPARLAASIASVPRIAVVSDSMSDTTRDLVAAWRAFGLDAVALSTGEAVAQLHRGDVALGRIDVRPSLDGIEPGLRELSIVERLGVTVLNGPQALLRTHDKLRTARALEAAGLPHPETVHVRGDGRLPVLRPPLVVKSRFGSWGTDVFRCDSPADVRRTFAAIAERPWFRRCGAVVQSLVPPRGHDLRILVAAGQVVGAERRFAAADEWRTNISLGGRHGAVTPTPAACRLAVAAATAVGGDVVGVDLLPFEEGHVVLEVNGAVDFTAEYSLPGRDTFEDIALALGLLEPALVEQPDLAARS